MVVVGQWLRCHDCGKLSHILDSTSLPDLVPHHGHVGQVVHNPKNSRLRAGSRYQHYIPQEGCNGPHLEKH